MSIGIAGAFGGAVDRAAPARQRRYRALSRQEPRPQSLRVLHRSAAGRDRPQQADRRQHHGRPGARRIHPLFPAAIRRAHARTRRRRGAGALAPSDARHRRAGGVHRRSPKSSTSSRRSTASCSSRDLSSSAAGRSSGFAVPRFSVNVSLRRLRDDQLLKSLRELEHSSRARYRSNWSNRSISTKATIISPGPSTRSRSSASISRSTISAPATPRSSA